MPIPCPPSETDLENHPVVSAPEWVRARKDLLEAEKALSRQMDAVSEQRRRLPWVKVEQDYCFSGPDGNCRLDDLFRGRRQLLVYHFMFGPGWKEGCSGCSFLADHLDGARLHFEQNDLAFCAISRAPWQEFLPFQKRMGWKFPWVSSFGTSFNYDFGVSFTNDQLASGDTFYNFATTDYRHEELHGLSVFFKKSDGTIYRTYSAYARGTEMLASALLILDLCPRGRNEKDTMDWVKLHDQYGQSSDHLTNRCPTC